MKYHLYLRFRIENCLPGAHRVVICLLVVKKKIGFYSQINADANYNLNGYVRSV